MTTTIRALQTEDIPQIVVLSLAAWAPVRDSFRQILGEAIFQLQYPDFDQGQQNEVERVCGTPEKFNVYVAEVEGNIAGFVANELNHDTKTGEVYLLAVHPDYQNQGIGTDLNLYALEQMRAAGMRMAVVGTGGDPAHAPARRSYEKAGYTALPLTRYYKDLKQDDDAGKTQTEK